jgi:hypothetical protein
MKRDSIAADRLIRVRRRTMVASTGVATLAATAGNVGHAHSDSRRAAASA